MVKHLLLNLFNYGCWYGKLAMEFFFFFFALAVCGGSFKVQLTNVQQGQSASTTFDFCSGRLSINRVVLSAVLLIPCQNRNSN